MKKIIWNLTNGLLAGIMIAVGGTVFLACFGDGSMLNKTIGAFFFSIALLSICYKGLPNPLQGDCRPCQGGE